MGKFTFLTKEQVFGEDRLDIIEKYGTRCAVTDFSILLNGSVFDFPTEEDKNSRTGFWWTKSSDTEIDAYAVTASGDQDYYAVIDREIGCRPAIKYSSIVGDSKFKRKGYKGILEVLYGEYPQSYENSLVAFKLEQMYFNRSLKKTGKTYTADSVLLEDYHVDFRPRVFTEYTYNGQKYIRVFSDDNCVGKTLNNGLRIANHEPLWIRVEPITCLVD